MKTAHFSVAEARLGALLKEHRERRGKEIDASNAKMTFGDAATLHMHRVADDVSIKRRTRQYWQETLDALHRSWPNLAGMEIRRVTENACREWAARYAKTASPSRYNNTLSLLRRIIEVAIKNGVIHANAAVGLERKSIRPKQLELPTRMQFAAFVAEMRVGRGRDSRNCADFAEGLAFTGCRISEAAQIEWRDIDFARGEILVKGDAEEATKNGEIRRVPLIPSAHQLFIKMRQIRPDEPQTSKVFLVRESQKSMDRAAKKIGMTRITHHDLRHFFATICIESGVDIPTVSRWLGHKDGGALAMRTYGHLRREHSLAQAQKVSFAPLPSDETTASFAASAALSPPDAGKKPQTRTPSSSRQRKLATTSWVDVVADERPRRTAKRSRESARER